MNQNLVRHHPCIGQDVDTLSFSSQNSSKNQSMSGFGQSLYNNVVKQLRKNEEKYVQIVKQFSDFNFQLYKPRLGSIAQGREAYNSELLAKQLDRLMEDEYVLDKQLSKISLKKQEDDIQKQIETNLHIDNYSFLRSMWNKPQKQSTASDEKIDQVNRKVVIIKSFIKNLTRKQYSSESVQLQKYVLESKEYLDLQERIQNFQNQYRIKQQKYNLRIQQLQKHIQNLKQTHEHILKKSSQQSEKLKKKDDQLLKMMQRYQDLQLQIIRKQKQIKKISKNYQHLRTRQSNINLKLDAMPKDLETFSQSVLQPQKNTQNLNLQRNIQFYNKIQKFVVNLSTSENLNENTYIQTQKSLHQIKQYLTSVQNRKVRLNNVLEQLIESKIFNKPNLNSQSNKHIRINSNINLQLLDRLQKRQCSRKKNRLQVEKTNDGNNESRSQMYLGSTDKKKRFQRTKNIQQIQN